VGAIDFLFAMLFPPELITERILIKPSIQTGPFTGLLQGRAHHIPLGVPVPLIPILLLAELGRFLGVRQGLGNALIVLPQLPKPVGPFLGQLPNERLHALQPTKRNQTLLCGLLQLGTLLPRHNLHDILKHPARVHRVHIEEAEFVDDDALQAVQAFLFEV
jgi:hypothetical protein